jgi:hypothetical protein
MNGTKGVAMSAGRSWIREFYVGFLLLALTFLYLSHLNTELSEANLLNEPGATHAFDSESVPVDTDLVAT